MPQITTTDEQNIPVWLINLTAALNTEAKTWSYPFPELSPEMVLDSLNRHGSERRQEFLRVFYSDPSMSYEMLAELVNVTPAHAELTMEWIIPDILGKLKEELQYAEHAGEEYDAEGRRILWYTFEGLYYVDTDGIIKKDSNGKNIYGNEARSLRIEKSFEEALAERGYRPSSRAVMFPKLLEENLGKTWEEFLADVDRRVSDSAKSGESRRRILADDARRLNDMNSRFNGMVRCFEKSTLRIFNTGFTVKILLDTDDMNEMTKFIRENSKTLLEWVIESIRDTKKIMKFIGNMDFYAPVRMVCLKGGEVEVFFEVKEKKSEKTP